MNPQGNIDELCINTIRTLSIDAVQKANSGHPGAPMGLAPVAYTVWHHFLRYDPDEPLWADRDRFVLSAGHASMLLYSLLHLAQVKRVDAEGRGTDELELPLEQIRNFRQLHSRTPGHPESHLTTGVEMTTGPLGQGVATTVGMAIAAKWKAARYNRPGFELFKQRVFAICSDGDLMEGVSHEAASLAGHQGLDNLCWLYDANEISIDGGTDLAFSENVRQRFESYGWKVLDVPDANDIAALRGALEGFEAERHAPTLIIVRSHIGFGAPNKQDSASAHGEPLGAEEARGAKRAYSWPEDAEFLVPDGVYEHFAAGVGARGTELRTAWEESLSSYRDAHAEAAEELDLLESGDLPARWDDELPFFEADEKGIATRKASAKVLATVAPRVPWLVAGSADLTDSNSIRLPAEAGGVFDRENRGGRQVYYGVREHAAAAAANGMALSGLRPAWATFLIFSDYARASIRLSALMEIPTVHVFTHDSIGLGEDGPTHQPIEQLASLRAIPNLNLIRPCDANETAEAWRMALERTDGPTALALSRQNLPVIDRERYGSAAGLRRGGYVLADAGGAAEDGTGGSAGPDLILVATGSEVALALAAHETLVAEGVASRVVSLPSWWAFEAQASDYRDSVLPPKVTARLAVEQASPLGWERWVGTQGEILAMRSFGASAPYLDVQAHFGFTTENVVAAARRLLT